MSIAPPPARAPSALAATRPWSGVKPATREPVAWRLPTRSIAVRLFLTCWLIYGLHFATNTVREIFLALAIGDHLSFRVDEYAHMHPDLFEEEGFGWHIGANPGASMVAAVPYALARPVIDRVVESVNRRRAANSTTGAPAYNSPWPMARRFFEEAWRRGYDIKFGLAALVMQALAMAPTSALGAVVMFYLLRQLLGSERRAFWLALLYAFGTPVFFRTGTLNHNLMLGHFAFAGLVVMWNPSGSPRPSMPTRYVLAGLAGGAALLFDYSGGLLLGGLLAYGLVKRGVAAGWDDAVRHGAWYVLGAVGPVLLLWFYQWQSFGHPFFPGQHWMPPVEWIDRGYQGVSGPQLDLLVALAFDHRFGLFVVSPLMLLAFLCPFRDRGPGRRLPALELAWMLGMFAALWVLFSGVNYTRLQFNSGIRYLAPVFPLLFVPAAIVLTRLPQTAAYLIAVVSVAESWSLAMYRDVERGLGVLDPLLQVLLGGFQLPVLTVLSRLGGPYTEYVARGTSPLPLFALAAAVLFVIWAPAVSRGRRP